MADSPKPRVNRWWPEVSDVQSARATGRNGAWSSFIGAGATIFLIAIKAFPQSALVDAAIFLVLGVLILRMSRAAAVVATVLFVGERAYSGATRGFGTAVGGVSLALLWGFILGVRGTFAYHRLKRSESSAPKVPVEATPLN